MTSTQRTNKHEYGERAFWLKGNESKLALDHRVLTVILRAGDRSSKELAPQQWLPMFEPIPVYRLVDGSGDQAKGIPPDFHPDDGTTVKIVRRAVGRLGDIHDGDLQFDNGCAVPKYSHDVQNYFETEMAPGKKFSPDTIVTIYWIEYLPNETPATD